MICGLGVCCEGAPRAPVRPPQCPFGHIAHALWLFCAVCIYVRRRICVVILVYQAHCMFLMPNINSLALIRASNGNFVPVSVVLPIMCGISGLLGFVVQ